MDFETQRIGKQSVFCAAAVLICFGVVPQGVAAQVGQLSGVVLDASGAPVPGAMVEADVNGMQAGTLVTGDDGGFTLMGVPAGAAVLIARAEGFADAVLQVAAPTDGIRLVLYPAPIFATVTVTATRGAPDLETPTSATVLTSADLALSAAGALDDALRSTPGFSLFRRSSSRVANPTTQGVTLRGVSGSGASRAKVLADGIPLNDPFGNWVYWNRIPEAAIDRVEVVRGAAGDLYGASALGGVIQILTLDPDRPTIRATFEGGSHSTVRFSGFGGGQTNGWSYQAAAEFLDTDGVVIVRQKELDPACCDVDIEAFSNYQTGFAGLGYTAASWSWRFRTSVYDEDRGNGTPLQVNDTQWRNVAADLQGATQRGAWSVRLDGGTQSYYQTFSAVRNNRNTEFLTRFNEGPTEFFNVSGQWVQTLGGDHVLMVGGEGRRVEGTVNSTSAFSGVTDQLGGTETNGSLFGQVLLGIDDRTTVRLGARGDFWSSSPLRADDPEHSSDFFSPRATIAFLARNDVSLQASVYRSWRNPSLNELYRGFQVGSIVTRANPQLEPERLTGVEGGAVFTRGAVSARVTGFVNHLDDAVANVTIGPNLRQRQNASQIRAAGVEFEVDYRPHPTLSVGAVAAFTRSTFRDSEKQPQLDGNRVPQVPQWNLGGSVTFADPRYLNAAVQVRGAGDQFDDDLNRFMLGAFGVVDAFISRGLTHGVNVFVAAENLLDESYEVRTNPFTVGWPRTFRLGVRVTLP